MVGAARAETVNGKAFLTFNHLTFHLFYSVFKLSTGFINAALMAW
jgi:hypothetical protein